MNLVNWARLVRIPTVFTILADVSASYLLVAGELRFSAIMAVVVAAGICLYWSGMIFNDVFDIEQDRIERPNRPLPSAAISVTSAIVAAVALLVTGVSLAWSSGYLAGETANRPWLPGLVSLALAGSILLYDGVLKKTALGPVAMGSCRVLSFLLGASAALTTDGLEPIFPTHILVAAVGMGTYVMGVTLIARREASETSRQVVFAGILVITLGCVLMALTPRFASPDVRFAVTGNDGFALLIGMLGFTVVYRAMALLSDRSPKRVQTTVKAGLLTLIPLAASFAFLGAGPIAGGLIFALVIPAMFVATQFRMT